MLFIYRSGTSSEDTAVNTVVHCNFSCCKCMLKGTEHPIATDKLHVYAYLKQNVQNFARSFPTTMRPDSVFFTAFGR